MAAIVRTSGKSHVTYDAAIFGPLKENRQTHGDAPIRVGFTHRLNQWEWLCNHFKAEAFQWGAKAFVLRAHDLRQKGEQAPHLTTYVEAYKKYDPDRAAVQSARTTEVEKIMADIPLIIEVSDGTSPACAPTLLPVLTYETQASVLETVVGPSRGTRVRGLVSGSAKLTQNRDPSSQTDSGRSTELEVEVA
ncbi:hypothetical protein LguiB_021754 [Lonicera macranthoides]